MPLALRLLLPQSSTTCLEITEKKGRSNRLGGVGAGRSMQMWGKELVVGGHTQPQTLTRPWETGLDILSRQDIPVQRKSFGELKAAPGGKGAGVKAALTAQSEKKWRCPYPWTEVTAIHNLPNTHAYSTPPSCKVDTGSMHTQWCLHTPWLAHGLAGIALRSTQGLGLQLQVPQGLHRSPADSNKGVCVKSDLPHRFGRPSLLSIMLRQPATN